MCLKCTVGGCSKKTSKQQTYAWRNAVLLVWGSLILVPIILIFLHQITPLHLAAEGARVRTVEYLVDEGADINIQDDKGVMVPSSC